MSETENPLGGTLAAEFNDLFAGNESSKSSIAGSAETATK
jgi:hypothetical protein